MLELTPEQRKDLIDYMARRPYAEVYALMAMLMNLKPVNKDDVKSKKRSVLDVWVMDISRLRKVQSLGEMLLFNVQCVTRKEK